MDTAEDKMHRALVRLLLLVLFAVAVLVMWMLDVGATGPSHVQPWFQLPRTGICRVHPGELHPPATHAWFFAPVVQAFRDRHLALKIVDLTIVILLCVLFWQLRNEPWPYPDPQPTSIPGVPA